MKWKLRLSLISLLLLTLLTGCSDKTTETALQDGYYTAQAAEFSHGWKEYITIMVKGGNIVSVEYNAENASGFIKSWDSNYMQVMLNAQGTYPNEYTRYYAGQLQDGQGQGQHTVDGGQQGADHQPFQLAIFHIHFSFRRAWGFPGP